MALVTTVTQILNSPSPMDTLCNIWNNFMWTKSTRWKTPSDQAMRGNHTEAARKSWGTLAINPSPDRAAPSLQGTRPGTPLQEQSSAVQAPPLSRERLREEPRRHPDLRPAGLTPKRAETAQSPCLTLWPRELQHARLLAPRTPWTQWKGKRPTALWKLMGGSWRAHRGSSVRLTCLGVNFRSSPLRSTHSSCERFANLKALAWGARSWW